MVEECSENEGFQDIVYEVRYRRVSHFKASHNPSWNLCTKYPCPVKIQDMRIGYARVFDRRPNTRSAK